MLTFARYLLVQAASYVLDLGTFLALHELAAIDPVLANACGKVVAGCLAFAAHRAFTFRIRDAADTYWQATRYFSLLAVNTPLSSGVLALLLHVIPAPVLAKFVSDVICVALTFALTQSFVFRRHDSKARA
jgi:putative flippase GtrA